MKYEMDLILDNPNTS